MNYVCNQNVEKKIWNQADEAKQDCKTLGKLWFCNDVTHNFQCLCNNVSVFTTDI